MAHKSPKNKALAAVKSLIGKTAWIPENEEERYGPNIGDYMWFRVKIVNVVIECDMGDGPEYKNVLEPLANVRFVAPKMVGASAKKSAE